MDKNLAAFIREDATTVGVRFFQEPWNRKDSDVNMTLLGVEDVDIKLSGKEYTYISSIPLEVDNLVIVYALGTPKVAVVTRVDESLIISPKDTIEYKWVVSKVDLSDYLKNIEKNKVITDLVKTAYRKNVKEQFKDLVLAGLDNKNKKALQNLLKGS